MYVADVLCFAVSCRDAFSTFSLSRPLQCIKIIIKYHRHQHQKQNDDHVVLLCLLFAIAFASLHKLVFFFFFFVSFITTIRFIDAMRCHAMILHTDAARSIGSRLLLGRTDSHHNDGSTWASSRRHCRHCRH